MYYYFHLSVYYVRKGTSMRRNHANTDGNICLLPNLSEIMKLEVQMRHPRNIIVHSLLV